MGNSQVSARPCSSPQDSRTGLVYGISAYALWGVFPVYFYVLAHVSPLVILCHRILWSALFIAGVVSVRREWPAIGQLLRNGGVLVMLSMGSLLIAANWLIFIYAVGSRQTLQASLGYFINPLVSIALGMLFLRERLRAWQWVAVGIAAAGVANLAWRGVGLPWIAISLALTFGLYGLVRKKVDINSLHGLLVETSILVPVAALLLVFLPASRVSGNDWGLLSLSGIITAVPLLCFGAAVRRLKLATVGFLQYIGPSLQFLIATTLFHEPLDSAKLTSFALCWLAIAVYVAGNILTHRPQPVVEEPE